MWRVPARAAKFALKDLPSGRVHRPPALFSPLDPRGKSTHPSRLSSKVPSYRKPSVMAMARMGLTHRAFWQHTRLGATSRVCTQSELLRPRTFSRSTDAHRAPRLGAKRLCLTCLCSSSRPETQVGCVLGISFPQPPGRPGRGWAAGRDPGRDCMAAAADLRGPGRAGPRRLWKQH